MVHVLFAKSGLILNQNSIEIRLEFHPSKDLKNSDLRNNSELKLEELIETESDGFQEALFQIDPEILNVPEVTTRSFCLD
ncbi:hypothetical protein BpHYR1_018720 [Brachionus plicatilis]|uniref:Uncharacterized protein n=1 Tax=Brachionus plicatilis TaxID=10195 RepID=A0A3M7PKD0_BRAPC|nr:hypothetical protein BpHYR1_018720 [Brachionus plicatilis]